MGNSSFLVGFLGVLFVIAQCSYMGEADKTIPITCKTRKDCDAVAAKLGCMKDIDCFHHVACKDGAVAVCGDHNICQCKPLKPLGCQSEKACMNYACKGGKTAVCDHNICQCKSPKPADIIIDQGTKLGCKSGKACMNYLCKGGKTAHCGPRNICVCPPAM